MMKLEDVIRELLRCIRFNYLDEETKKKIAHAAEKIIVNLEGMSKSETKKTLELVKILLEDYLVVSVKIEDTGEQTKVRKIK